MTIMNREAFFARIAMLPTGDLADIQQAYWLAKSAHRVQAPRDGGGRYFDHPREVALTLIDRCHMSKSIIIKGLLHDCIEDTFTLLQAYLSLFGQDVYGSLLRLSKYVPVFHTVNGSLIGRYKKDEGEYYEALASGPLEDRLVKCADRRHNLMTMGEGWSAEKQRNYGKNTRKYILPFARETDAWFADELDRLSLAALKTT